MMNLLHGCAGQQETKKRISDYYASMKAVSIQMSVFTDYGDTAAKYRLKHSLFEDKHTLYVLEPSELAGLSVTINEGAAVFEYAGAVIDMGALYLTEISPLVVLPSILSEWSGGIISETSNESIDGTPYVSAVYTATVQDTALVYRSWFHLHTLEPLKTEVYQSNRMILRCDYESVSIQ